MTRWGIVADIHGNLPNLERALAGFRERDAKRIAVLGDNLGRGDSDGCVALIKQVADISVLGNRDLDWQDRVGEAARVYVLQLPRIVQADGIAFAHGDARLTRDLSSDDIRTGGFPARPRSSPKRTPRSCSTGSETWRLPHDYPRSHARGARSAGRCSTPREGSC